jgi:hypothetical protein
MFKITIKQILDWLRNLRKKAKDTVDKLPEVPTLFGGELESDEDWDYEVEPVE